MFLGSKPKTPGGNATATTPNSKETASNDEKSPDTKTQSAEATPQSTSDITPAPLAPTDQAASNISKNLESANAKPQAAQIKDTPATKQPPKKSMSPVPPEVIKTTDKTPPKPSSSQPTAKASKTSPPLKATPAVPVTARKSNSPVPPKKNPENAVAGILSF